MTIASANRACLCRLGCRTTRKFGTRLAQQLWVTPQSELNHVLNQQWTHKDPRKKQNAYGCVEGMCLAAFACSSTLKPTSIVPYIISTCKRVCTVLFRTVLGCIGGLGHQDPTIQVTISIYTKRRGVEAKGSKAVSSIGSGAAKSGEYRRCGRNHRRAPQGVQNGPNSCFTSEAL